jgi:uncharacterized membrane protein HdeD (DUF308 family)
MQSIPMDALEHVATQLALLNLLLGAYLICKGVAFVSAVIARRDPPKKSNRPKLAQSDGS